MTHKDYYTILGLDNNASADAIKKAYRRLAMQYHPDRNNGREEWASEKFKQINEAFYILGDPKNRVQYDHFGTAGNFDDILGSRATRETLEDLVKDFDGAGLGVDFFDDVFGSSFGSKGFAFYKFKKRITESPDMGFESPGDFNFQDLFEQAGRPVVSGANYEIVISQEQALRGMEKELVRKGRRLRVKIPAGVKMGSKIKLKDALRATDDEPGDIIINIKVR